MLTGRQTDSLEFCGIRGDCKVYDSMICSVSLLWL